MERFLRWFLTGLSTGILDKVESITVNSIAWVFGFSSVLPLMGLFGWLGVLFVALNKGSWLVKEMIYLSGYLVAMVILNDILTAGILLLAIVILAMRKFG